MYIHDDNTKCCGNGGQQEPSFIEGTQNGKTILKRFLEIACKLTQVLLYSPAVVLLVFIQIS